MASHELVECPRCRQDFECKCGSIGLCHCTKVELGEEQREFIANQYQGCLCHDCLQQYAQQQQ